MGDWASGWAKDIQEQIKTTYESYPSLSFAPFDTLFEFVEINYNSWFDDLRKQWKEEADKVVGLVPAGQIGAGALSQLLKIAQEPAKDVFLATHVLDVVLYRFVSTVHEAVKADVQKQILDAILNANGTVKGPWSIVAHSLGTSVTHDVLNAMYSQELDYKGHKFKLASLTRPQLVAMIANVSKVLESDADVYTSVVRPALDPSAGACKQFLSARHEFDPFMIPKQFRPTHDWPSVQAVSEKRVHIVPINAIEKKNVHALDHYLKNPQVHVRLFRCLLWPEAIPDSVLDSRSHEYELSTPLAKFEGLLKELKKIKLSDNSQWKEIIQGFRDFAELVGISS
jgi:hypothetical protein